MRRNLGPLAFIAALTIGTFVLLGIDPRAVPCEVYLNNVQQPGRDDLTWPIFAHCYYVECGIRL